MFFTPSSKRREQFVLIVLRWSFDKCQLWLIKWQFNCKRRDMHYVTTLFSLLLLTASSLIYRRAFIHSFASTINICAHANHKWVCVCVCRGLMSKANGYWCLTQYCTQVRSAHAFSILMLSNWWEKWNNIFFLLTAISQCSLLVCAGQAKTSINCNKITCRPINNN